MKKTSTILITGGSGMVGKALYKRLVASGYENIIAPGVNFDRVDLTEEKAVDLLFEQVKPDYVFMIAAKVGGINVNKKYPVEFLTENLRINLNLFTCCHKHAVKKCLYLGSSCIYPSDCKQPMKEEYLMTGNLEPTNYGYALAKIVGLKLAKYYFEQYGLKTVCLMPPNLYHEEKIANLENAHVLESLIKRFCDAKINDEVMVELWGTGKPRREFLHTDDVVDAILYFFDKVDSPEIINIGSGEDLSIKELANTISNQVGYNGAIFWDTTKPNGMMKKLMDNTKMKVLGFEPKVNLLNGIKKCIKVYMEGTKK